jgi:hypothetical protein
MKGTVKRINQTLGMVAVLTLGDEVEVGDAVRWKGSTPLGSEDVMNHTRRKSIHVYFQDHHVPPAQLKQQLLY